MAYVTPLLTTFTAAPWCSETAINFDCDVLAGGDASCSGYLYPVTSETSSCSLVYPTDCNPSPGLAQSYSPGLICPHGWTSAVTISHAPDGSLATSGIAPSAPYYKPRSAETVVYCCPSGMTILSAESTARSLTCDQVLTSGIINAAVRSCDISSRPPTTLSTAFDPGATLFLTGVGDIPTRTYSNIAYHLRAGAIQIRWASSDVDQNTPDSTMVVTLNQSGSAGLSTGARIGVAVGVTLGCLLLIGLLVVFILFHRRQKSQRGLGSHSTPLPRSSTPGFQVMAVPVAMVAQPGTEAPTMMKDSGPGVKVASMATAPGQIEDGIAWTKGTGNVAGSRWLGNGAMPSSSSGPAMRPGESRAAAMGEEAVRLADSAVPATDLASSESPSQDRLSTLLARQQQVRKEADRIRELLILETEDRELQEEIDRLRTGSGR